MSSTPEKVPIHLLMVTVAEMGGGHHITEADKWGEVAKKMGLLKDSGANVKKVYEDHVKKNMNKQDNDSEPSDEEEYEVERIVDDKKKGKHSYFLVKWKGFSEAENSWEPENNLTNCQNMIKAYREQKAKRKAEATTTDQPDTLMAKKLKTDNSSSNATMDPNASFETDIAEMVIGACQTNQGLNLIVKWKGDSEKYTWMSSSDCRKHIPQLLLDFYEARIKFVGS
eukprot:c6138_g1_i1.p1 GENE.c6138_g1_i1~~c6138_g1_i1.p1  ORF type:complete len:262 (-),score=66.13 c6138_g1_i1:279-956(-)